MNSESDATAWKLLLLFCIYSANHPRGAASTTSNPHPIPRLSLIPTSYITHLFLSHNQIKASEWSTVNTFPVVFTCVTRLSHLLSCQT